MKAYRSLFVCSLCAHILLLAYTETILVSVPPRLRPLPIVTIFQKAIPLPMGEPAAGPPAGEPAAPPPAPEPQVAPPPPQTPPKPPKKVRKKPTPRPPREIAKVEPPPEPLPLIENQPTIGPTSEGEEAGSSLDGNTSAAVTEGGGRTGSSQGRGLGDGNGGGGGGALAKPDYGVNPKPPYPMVARRMGAEGIVVLRVFVYPDGSVGEVVVSRSSGFSILDDSALNTVRDRWRFVPARLDGRPVESWVEVPIRFVLEKG